MLFFLDIHREELIRHYDMLTREAERREMRTMWLARRQALKKERETFLEDETNRLERMRTEMNDKLEKEERLTAVRDDEHKSISFTKRKQWVMNDEASNPIIKGENGVGQLTAHPSHSTVQNLIYYEDVRNSQTGIPDKTLVESRQSLEREVKTPARHPAESTVQNLIYPSTTKNIVSQTTTEHPTSDVERSRGTKENGYLSLSKSSDVTIKSAVGRAKGSTIEHLLYPADEKSSVTVISTVDTEPPSPNEGLFYRDTISKDFRVRSTRGSAPPSTIETLLYPDNANEDFRVKSTRGREPPSTIQKLLYPSVSDIPGTVNCA